MRAFAPAQFTLTRFDAWRRAVWVVGGAVALAAGAWLVRGPSPSIEALLACAGLVLALSIWVAWLLWPARAPLSLRWDGQSWHLGAVDAAGHDPVRGELRVMIDLGPWMLLRFAPAASRRATWLPVQRRGLEAHWHALRCAVYSPRPDAGVDAAPDV